MHEFGVAQAAVRQIEARIPRGRERRVRRIGIRVGALSGIDSEALRFAVELLLPDSAASGAELQIEAVPARVRCGACGAEFEMAAEVLFECPACHAIGGTVLRGRELELFRVEFA